MTEEIGKTGRLPIMQGRTLAKLNYYSVQTAMEPAMSPSRVDMGNPKGNPGQIWTK